MKNDGLGARFGGSLAVRDDRCCKQSDRRPAQQDPKYVLKKNRNCWSILVLTVAIYSHDSAR
jgi:hypothetical protein